MEFLGIVRHSLVNKLIFNVKKFYDGKKDRSL